ncbi:MAG: nitroreductase family deazaflavin-dependent oxidoreductase [Actinomycetota bacterium]|nr:nitroreductase family deazaflavin-dependent oxidoreductase [Actinomycetota bacterium]MDA3013151.1 nitroreductase family deazaflavin-dependent oxidoreductase [Actinomycetota bacterium]
MKRKLIFLFLFFHNYIYIYSNGLIGKMLYGRPCLILHSIGAKTKKQRKNVLVFLREENFVCIVASKGGSPSNPGWYYNLKKNSKCIVQIGNKKYNATAREIFNSEREEWWAKMDYLNNGIYTSYQKRTERVIPLLILELS